MKKSNRSKKSRKKTRFGLFLFVLVISFALSTGSSYFLLKDEFAFDSAFLADIEARQDKEGLSGQGRDARRLYGAGKGESDSEGSVVLREDNLLVVTEDIIRNYVKSYKVRLLDLYMDKEGVIYIDFGDEFNKNFHGDAFEEVKVIAGLYGSIKSTIPGFSALKILIEGREADSLGGHIDISRPIGEEIAEHI
jgi:hypothetical protein